MRYAIVNVNLEIPVPDNATDEQAQEIAENYELPKEYVSESYEFLKVTK
jgi:hypothetical protein